jgi:FMN reductase
MRTFTVVVLSAGLGRPSSTRMLADQLADATKRSVVERGGRVELIPVELRELAHDITDNLLTGFPSLPLRTALDAVSSADAVIAVTPVFSASYSGLFKSFFDVLDPAALDGTPVLIAATGGSARHSLVLEHALRPLFGYLRASVVPTAVFAATADFGADESGRSLTDRVHRAGRELGASLTTGNARTSSTSAITDDGVVARGRRGRDAEPFEHLVPFEQLLGRR